MKRFALRAVVACLCGYTLAGTGRADFITQNFTITVSPAATLVSGDNLFLKSLSQFNPAKGTLLGVLLSLNGPATWTSTSTSPQIEAGEYVGFNTGGDILTTPGPITFGPVGLGDPSTLSIVTGTGSVLVGLDVVDFSQSPFTDTFKTGTGGIAGTLTYDFTPNTTAVPEPSSLTLLALGSLGLIGYAWRRRKPAA